MTAITDQHRIHQDCALQDRLWIPVVNTTPFLRTFETVVQDDYGAECSVNYTEVIPHPYCIHCGLIKNLSGDKGHEIGFWYNVLGEIARRHRLTQVQRRLITKKMQDEPFFSDTYAVTGTDQRGYFTNIITSITDLDIDEVERIINRMH